MTARANVQPDFPEGVAIYLGRTGNIRTALKFGQPESVLLAEGAAPLEPSLRLEEDVARALLDALAQYFGGTSESLTLRRDYLDERSRVDRLIKHLIEGD